MEQILYKNGRKYNIGGFILGMEFGENFCSFMGEDVWNAFEEKSEKSSDFSLFIHSDLPNLEDFSMEKQLIIKDNEIAFNYSNPPSYLILNAHLQDEVMRLYYNDDIHPNDWFRSVGTAFAWLCLNHNACNMHAVILEHQGKGILLTAPSGTGKSTHAHYWRDVENALIINGDRALLRLIDGKWWACGSPWRGNSGECVNRKVPLSAIVVLKRGDLNQARKMSPIEGITQILPRIIAPIKIPELGEKAMEYAFRIAETIPIFELKCQNHPSSVDEIKRALIAESVLE